MVLEEEEERLLVYSGSDARIVGGSNFFFFSSLFFPPLFFFFLFPPIPFSSPCPPSSLPHFAFALSALQIPAGQESRCRAARPGSPGHAGRPAALGRAPGYGHGYGHCRRRAAGRGCHAAGQADGLAAARRAMPEAAELGRRRGHHPQQRPQEAQLHLPDGAAPALHLGAR